MCSNGSYERTWFYGVRVYCGIKKKNQAGMIALGECFYVQTLWNLERLDTLGGLWVLSTPDTLLEIVRVSPSPSTPASPAVLYIFRRCHGALIGESNWVEFDSTSMELTGQEALLCVSEGGQLRQFTIWLNMCSWLCRCRKYKFQNSFHGEASQPTLQYKLGLCCWQSSACLKAGLSRAREP